MKIILNDEELKDVLHYCFCNGGISELRRSDVEMIHDGKAYEKARKELIASGKKKDEICREDVWLQILVGGDTIKFIDHNEDGKEVFLTYGMAAKNIEACPKSAKYIIGMLDELNAGEADAFDCWEMLQIMLYKQIIYG